MSIPGSDTKVAETIKKMSKIKTTSISGDALICLSTSIRMKSKRNAIITFVRQSELRALYLSQNNRPAVMYTSNRNSINVLSGMQSSVCSLFHIDNMRTGK